MNFPAASFLPVLGLLLAANPSSAQDTDADGILDVWEETWHLDTDSSSDADVDFDRDGLTAVQEYGLALQNKGAGPLGEWILQKISLTGVIGADSPKELVTLNDNDDALLNVSTTSVWIRRAKDGIWRSLSTVNGSPVDYIRAHAMNDQGEVVGVARRSGVNGGNPFAFKKNVFSDSSSTNVSPWYLPGEASAPASALIGINNHGDLIGRDSTGSSFHYSGITGGLVTVPSGWIGVEHLALNQMGQSSGSAGVGLTPKYNTDSHFLISPGWHQLREHPAYPMLEIIDPELYDPDYYVFDGEYTPSILNDWGEYAGPYWWSVSQEGSLEEEGEGIAHYQGSHVGGIPLSDGLYSDRVILDMNNWPQLLMGGNADPVGGEDFRAFINVGSQMVPISAITTDPALSADFFGTATPRQVNNRSTIAGIIADSDELYFLRLSQDRDGDRMPNDWEEFHGLDPDDPSDGGDQDADGDGYTNLEEFRYRGDPRNPAIYKADPDASVDAQDLDGDGLPDSWERLYAGAANYPWLEPEGDPDDDYLTNFMEWVYFTDPFEKDSDGDGMIDGWESFYGVDPLNPDTDGDGISDWDEQQSGTNPNDPDSTGPPPSFLRFVEKSTVEDQRTTHRMVQWTTGMEDADYTEIDGNPPNFVSAHDGLAFGDFSDSKNKISYPKGEWIYYGFEGENTDLSLGGYPRSSSGLGFSRTTWLARAERSVAHPSELTQIWILLEQSPGAIIESLRSIKYTIEANQIISDEEIEIKPEVDNRAVNVLPIELNSMDRFVAGSLPLTAVEEMGGMSRLGLVFRNPASQEEYVFENLQGAHIYDDPFATEEEGEDAFLSNSEIAAWANGPDANTKALTQDVVFWREDGMLHFRALFDQTGPIEIAILQDGYEKGVIEWTLTPDADMGSLLETIDALLSNQYNDPGTIPLMAAADGVSGEDLAAIQAVAMSLPSAQRSGFLGFLKRNLTIKVSIPTWTEVKDKFVEGARKVGEATDRALTVVAFTGKGFCEGAWYGAKDDATSLVELGKMLLNPAETAKTFYEGFRVLMKLDLEGWKNVGKTLVRSFIERGVEGVNDWAQPNEVDVAAYLVGFTAGYITEQIVMTYVTAGVLKAGNIGAKIGDFVRKAAKGTTAILGGVSETMEKMLKAKNTIFRRFSQDVTTPEDVVRLKRLTQEFELTCLLTN